MSIVQILASEKVHALADAMLYRLRMADFASIAKRAYLKSWPGGVTGPWGPPNGGSDGE